MPFKASVFAPALLLAVTAGTHAAGDPERGARVFRQCAACHSTAGDEHLTGPSLAHIWGREAGTVQGFTRYSDALKRAHAKWDPASLDKWLLDPDRFIPGTSMTFAGLKDAGARQDVIAYLQALSESKAKAPQPGGAAMGGMMGARKLDLRKAPPAGQVRSIKHCADAYTVETADGRRQKVWEFNLRFKTDSSALGPATGKPVVVGAGMQGDRASVVFASPAEISAFIKQSCD